MNPDELTPNSDQGPWIPSPEQIQEIRSQDNEELIEQVEKVLTGEQTAEEAIGESSEPMEAQFAMGLTPMGTVGIHLSDEKGNSVQYHISDPTELWQLAGHMQSLATLMVQTRYAMAMQEQRMIEEMMKKQPIHIPGHGMIG